jgi:hypothetical protein
MGQGESKSDTVVVNEQLSVNPTTVNSVQSSGADMTTINLIFICSIVTIFWVFLLKVIKHFFKKQVQAYAVNV